MKTVHFFAEKMVGRTDRDWDSLVIVESGATKGTGKTTFSVQLCKEICNIIGVPYDLGKMMVIDATEDKIRTLAKTLPRGTPIHADEAVMFAYKRDYNEDATKKFVKFVNICRKFGHPLILNIPWFWDLDKDVRNLADYRITVPMRGVACVRQKDINSDSEDLWLRKESDERQMKEIGHDMTDITGVVEGIKKCRNFQFVINFGKLDDATYKTYRELSMANEGKQLETNEKRPMVLLKVLSWLLLKKMKCSPTELTKEINQQIANSNYGQEYSKFKIPQECIKSYRDDWTDAMRDDLVVVSAVDNNKKISILEEKALEAAVGGDVIEEEAQ